MLGFGRRPEGEFSKEIIQLPTPTEYTGSFFERREGQSDLDTAADLAAIRREVKER